MTNRLKKYEVSWITNVMWLKDNMILYGVRLRLNRVECMHLGSNRNTFSRAVSGYQRSYAFSWITSVVRSKINVITQILCGETRIYTVCIWSSIMKVASECPVNAVICLVAVKDLEVNVAELSNARELEFCFGYASAVNVSVLKLIL
jgi:hypothetical protein